MPLAAFAFGWLVLAQNGRLAEKPARFDHLAERCSLLVIVTFGEMIVGITGYMEGSPDVLFAFLVFVFVVGLFLMYFFDYDYMLDHHREGPGVGFMLLTAWIVFVLGNITVSLEYLPEEGIDASVKGAYLASALCVYLASSASPPQVQHAPIPFVRRGRPGPSSRLRPDRSDLGARGIRSHGRLGVRRCDRLGGPRR